MVLKKQKNTLRRSDEVERKLLGDILSGQYKPGSVLPLERDLAAEFGVGRPTLREAIQRLERDGYLTVRKGQGTLVNDFWKTGSLNIISAVLNHNPKVSEEFVIYLLEIRAALAPAYVRAAVDHHPARVVASIVDWESLDDDADQFAQFDWKIQMELSELAPNPIFFLMAKSFDSVYPRLARAYFSVEENRESSRKFYQELLKAAMERDAEKAAEVTKMAMEISILNFKNKGSDQSEPTTY